MEKEQTKYKTKVSHRELGRKVLSYSRWLQMFSRGYIRIAEIPYQKRGIYTGEETYKEFTIEIRLPKPKG